MSKFTRREFLKTGGLALAGLTIAPSSILGKSHGHVPPSDRLNIAAVGIGGMGHTNINHVKATENIVALCDVDWRYAKGVFDELPNAKKYWDYRKMYDEMGKDIDAVIIATADHTHAIITADAMTMGKHVYCQKPLTHSVYESRLLTRLAASTGVVTQMGNQGSSDEGTDLVCEWIWNGEIGDVTKVECATDRPIWPQGLNTPEKAYTCVVVSCPAFVQGGVYTVAAGSQSVQVTLSELIYGSGGMGGAPGGQPGQGGGFGGQQPPAGDGQPGQGNDSGSSQGGTPPQPPSGNGGDTGNSPGGTPPQRPSGNGRSNSTGNAGSAAGQVI